MVDINARELIKPTIQADLPIHADVRQFLDKMLEQEYVPINEHKEWVKWCKDLLNRFPTARDEYHSDGLINPYIFIDKLFDYLTPEIILFLKMALLVSSLFRRQKLSRGRECSQL